MHDSNHMKLPVFSFIFSVSRVVFGTLYGRLVLILLGALAAHFAVLSFHFASHLERARVQPLARSLSEHVRLAEKWLAASPPNTGAVASIHGLTLAPAPQGVRVENPFLPMLAQSMGQELGRPLVVYPVEKPEHGFWVSLQSPHAPTWLFIRLPHKPPPPRRWGGIGFLATSLSFIMVLIGGMVLLWQVQKPLQQLRRALARVGEQANVPRLPVQGSREVQELTHAFNAMVARLQQYDEDRATMLAGVAHDLRTPMTRLRLQLELAGGARQAEMTRSLDHIEAIIEQFLTFARQDAAEARVAHQLDLLLAECLAGFDDRGDALYYQAIPCVVPVYANALRRALVNVVENAFEYGAAPVRVDVCVADRWVEIRVCDQGTGIDPADYARALRPFTRLDVSRGGKGHCGLGLAIVAQVVALHAGQLQLRTPASGGFEVCLQLPLTT